MKGIISTVLMIVIVGGLIVGRGMLASEARQENTVAADALSKQWYDRMMGIVLNPAPPPKLQRLIKEIKIDEKYVVAIFPVVHDDAWQAATLTGRRGKVEFDQFTYMNEFFKRMSAKALADKKPELANAIDKLSLATPKMDTSDWKPLPGSNTNRPRG